jgi:predicted GNAT family acetyltransferase
VSSIEHRPDRHCFEARLEGGRGEVAYRRQGEVMTIVHTEVDAALEGQGLGGRLVQAALDHARAEGLKVDPVCSYADAYMQRHPETEALRARTSSPSR